METWQYSDARPDRYHSVVGRFIAAVVSCRSRSCWQHLFSCRLTVFAADD